MQTLLLLDLDGTIIDTPHYDAWRNTALGIGMEELSYEQYISCIAGHPRLEGASRLLALKEGMSQESSNRSDTVRALAEAKQREFLRLSESTCLFEDAQRLLLRIESARQPVRFYTASQNAPRLFDAALRKSGVFLNQKIEVVRQQPDQTREALFHVLLGDSGAESVTLIDDSPYAADVACYIGIQGCQVRRHDIHPAATSPRCVILSSMDELVIPLGKSGELAI